MKRATKLNAFIGHLPLTRIINASFTSYRRAHRCMYPNKKSEVGIGTSAHSPRCEPVVFSRTNLTCLDRAAEFLMDRASAALALTILVANCARQSMAAATADRCTRRYSKRALRPRIRRSRCWTVAVPIITA